METKNKNLRWFHFLGSWALCIATGIGLQILFSVYFMGLLEAIGFSLLTAIIALAISAPFIILFCIIVQFTVLNKPRRATEIHLRVFTWHVVGSILVFLGMVIFFNSEMRNESGLVILVMLGYFIIDSIYFHSFIHKKMKNIDRTLYGNNEILDSF